MCKHAALNRRGKRSIRVGKTHCLSGRTTYVMAQVSCLGDVLFRAEALRFDHGGGRGIFGVSVHLAAGEIVALLGANGAGKTTFMECALGLRTAEEGDCVAGGHSLRRNRGHYLSTVGAQLQEEAHSPLLTVNETLDLHAAFHSDPEPRARLLEALGLGPWGNERAGTLSAGLRQRLSVALAFVHRPRVALLDEPMAGVDSEGRALIAGFLRDLAGRGGCVLFTTHIREDLELASRTIALAEGRLKGEP